MPNTVYGPYSATTWVDHTTLGNQTNMNHLESQASVALHGINSDLSGPFVLSGIVCTKDGTTANQLDIASGVAYVTLSDGTTGRITVVADNTHTTSALSSTYHLYLQPDGTWYWSTSNSPATNSLAIASVTTDGSGNILVVTDLRHTAGSPGVPIVVARSLHQLVTATTDTSITGITVGITGFYRASLYFLYSNGTPQKVIARTSFQDPDVGGAAFSYFMAMNSAAPGMILNGSQASTTGNNQGVGCAPLTMYAQAGFFMSVRFQDGGGTPNDRVSAIIERIG